MRGVHAASRPQGRALGWVARGAVPAFALAWLVFFAAGCGGGFEEDSDTAGELGPAIFGPDSVAVGDGGW